MNARLSIHRICAFALSIAAAATLVAISRPVCTRRRLKKAKTALRGCRPSKTRGHRTEASGNNVEYGAKIKEYTISRTS